MKNEKWVVEYSETQKFYHIHSLQDRIEKEARHSTDYNVIFEGTEELCRKYLERIHVEERERYAR